MKKAVCVILVLLLALTPASVLAADSSVCFIALNDSLLQLTSQAYSQGGQYYVPISVFSEFRIYSHYYDTTSTAQLYSSSKQMFFNIETGETYDSDDNYYTSSAIMRGGQVYVPVDFVCRQFGLSWSYIRGNGYGDVCRITDGSAALTDQQFLSAAQPLMASRYNEYVGSTLQPNDNPDNVTGGNVLFLSFQGMPSAELLTPLSAYGIKATFFLSAEDMASNPETLRRIVGEGHNVGILCSGNPDGEFSDGLEALYSYAKTATVLIASSSSDYDGICESYADANGLVFCQYSIDGVRSGRGITVSELSAIIDAGLSPISYLRIQCSNTTESNISGILSELSANCVILAACETSEP